MPHSGSSEKTKTIVEAYYRAYESGAWERLKPFLHTNHRYYPPGSAKPENLAHRLEDARLFFAAFSKVRVEVCDQIIDGNKAAMRIAMSALHSGDFHHIKATGRTITMTYMEFVRLEDDKILEDWAEFDMATILRQLS